MKHLFLSSIIIIVLGALGALTSGKRPNAPHRWGAGGVLLGCAIGLIPVGSILIGGPSIGGTVGWSIPYGSLSWEIDPLSAFFLLPTFLVSAAASVYGSRYLKGGAPHKNNGFYWFCLNTLVISMVLVMIARNGMFFLMAWEMMSLSSFFLVTYDHQAESVQRSGWMYLVATHLGTAFLFVLFLLLAREAGSMEMNRFEAIRFHGEALAGGSFLLACVGFGTKAGFIPFHVWLPEAHPAAPSHVSALMSGVMIKTGIYGLIRTLSFLHPISAWWGVVWIIFGLVSGILGVVFALAQHDLKRLLAYHSVENIGIIALGLGLGVIGTAIHQPILSMLGFSGALLHVLNHALFKALLFLGAGSVLHATQTRNMEALGGLIKRMPWTAATFAIGSIAICGLPPLNGFISEFLIYAGAYQAIGHMNASVPSALVILGLAMIGALALACFSKVFGVVFLGEPRTTCASQAHESPPAMVAPMVFLALSCSAIAAAAPWIPGLLAPIVVSITHLPETSIIETSALLQKPMKWIGWISLFVLLFALAFFWIRNKLVSRYPTASRIPTWDCGYLHPTPRMQYTASSYARPITRLFEIVLQTQWRAEPVSGLFPQKASLHGHTEDMFQRRFYTPLFRALDRLRGLLHWIQEGRVQIYILYIAVVLWVLLIWNIGGYR